MASWFLAWGLAFWALGFLGFRAIWVSGFWDFVFAGFRVLGLGFEVLRSRGFGFALGFSVKGRVSKA